MHERCDSCNTKFKIESSFFFGAMYVSYPVGLIFVGLAFLFSYIIFDLGLNITYLSILLVMIIFYPVIIRLSRNICINIFLHYKKPF